jgi:peptide deformylase
MPACEILQLGHPLLWQPAKPVEYPGAKETRALAADLSDTLAAFRAKNDFGRGIAAPQIGVLKRAIFIHIPPDGFAGALFNPTILTRSEEEIEVWDDCFSFPDLLVRVKRAFSITVQYEDEQVRRHNIDAHGDFAELLQHEIDHLDGILAVQRAVSPQAFSTRKEWERHYKKI